MTKEAQWPAVTHPAVDHSQRRLTSFSSLSVYRRRSPIQPLTGADYRRQDHRSTTKKTATRSKNTEEKHRGGSGTEEQGGKGMYTLNTR